MTGTSAKNVSEQVRRHDYIEITGVANEVHGRRNCMLSMCLDVRKLVRHLSEDLVLEDHTISQSVRLGNHDQPTPADHCLLEAKP